MHLHHLTLEKPSSVTHALAGNFYSQKSQDLVLIKGSQEIEILTQDLKTGLFSTSLSIPSFSQIRSVMSFRPVGFNKDFLVITSDSGNLSIIEFLETQKDSDSDSYHQNESQALLKSYRVVVQETIYRSGCRRISPGAFLAKDPKGRALFLAAVEKNKLIYLTSKSGVNNGISLSSPLEANIPNTITYDLVGLDNGYNNPLFVAIEADFGDVENKESALYTGIVGKFLAIYELDLGLNQVIRKKLIPIDQDARMLLSIPQTDSSVAGFAVAYDSKMTFYSLMGELLDSADLPVRLDNYKRKRFSQMICQTMFRLKSQFYFLVGNELGDMFRLGLTTENKLQIDYLFSDKISTCLAITKTGFLFKGNENCDHNILAVIDLENTKDNCRVGEYYVPVPLGSPENQQMDFENDDLGENNCQTIKIKDSFDGLRLGQTLPSLSGLVETKFADLTGDGIGQLYGIQGGVNGSRLVSLKFSLEVQKLTESTPQIKPKNLLPVRALNSTTPNGLPQTKYLLLTIEGKTCLLGVGEKITEVTEPVGFATEEETIHLFELRNDIRQNNVWVQITTKEIRVVFSADKFSQTQMISGKRIRLATHYEDKVLTINNANQIEFFRFNNVTSEMDSESRADLDQEVLCLCVFGGNSRTGSIMAALGFVDNTIKIYSLDVKSCLTRLSLLALQSPTTSMEFVEGHLLIGLASGKFNRVFVDPMTGALGEIRTRQLGNKPIRIFKDIPLNLDEILDSKVKENGKGTFVCGEQTFFAFQQEEFFELVNVNLNEPNRIRSLCPIENQIGERCFMYITENGSMKIVQVLNQKKGVFRDKEILLEQTGRKMLINKENLSLVVVQSQNRVHEKNKLTRKLIKLKSFFEKNLSLNIDLTAKQVSLLSFCPRSTQWMSTLTIINPFNFSKSSTFTLPGNNKHILAAQIVQFKENEGQQMLLVSVCEDHDILKNTFSSSYIVAYSFEDNNKRLSQVHLTKLDELCTEMLGFKGKLLAGVGGHLRLYELGKKQLLKKCEYKKKFHFINGLKTINRRIWLSDGLDSIHLLRLDDDQGQFSEIADDLLPRYTTCFEVLDYNTVAAADKFGNIFVLRLVQGGEEEQGKDFAAYNLRWEGGYLNGAPSKFEQLCSFYDVNAVASIHKVLNARNKFEFLMASNVEGKIMALVPFETKSEVDFFRHFELLMRMEEVGPIFPTGRNHLLYRGYYSAVKDVTDGDLCERFLKIDKDKKKTIGENLERTQTEIIKKIEDVRFLLV